MNSLQEVKHQVSDPRIGHMKASVGVPAAGLTSGNEHTLESGSLNYVLSQHRDNQSRRCKNTRTNSSRELTLRKKHSYLINCCVSPRAVRQVRDNPDFLVDSSMYVKRPANPNCSRMIVTSFNLLLSPLGYRTSHGHPSLKRCKTCAY